MKSFSAALPCAGSSGMHDGLELSLKVTDERLKTPIKHAEGNSYTASVLRFFFCSETLGYYEFNLNIEH